MNSRIFLFVIALMASSQVGAVTKTVNVCFKTNTSQYVDSGRRALTDAAATKEDYWVTNVNQPLKAALAVIKLGTTTLFNGYLGDGIGTGDPGSGCATPIELDSANSSLMLSYTVHSEGYTNLNTVKIIDEATNARISYSGFFYVCMVSCSTTPIINQTLSFTDSDARRQAMWSAYAAAAFAVYRHNGGANGKSFVVKITTSTGNFYTPSTQVVSLKEHDAYEKFTIVHELGHRISHLRGLSATFGACEQIELPTGDCRAVSGNHSMGSIEYTDCAFSEGLAHFYAADVWNYHSEDDGVFQYYKANASSSTTMPAVDIKSSPTDLSWPLRSAGGTHYPQKTLESRCGSPYDNRGAEVDWLRALWRVHTRGTSPPSFTEMMNWMEDAYASHMPWDNAYTELNYEAGVVGGTLESNWISAKALNGVDHP